MKLRIPRPLFLALFASAIAGSVLLLRLKAVEPEYELSRAVSVSVAGQPIQLPAGQTVTVVGGLAPDPGGNVMIRVVLPDGSLSIAQVPAAAIQQKVVAPTPAPPVAAAPIPSVDPAANAPAGEPAPGAALAGAAPDLGPQTIKPGEQWRDDRGKLIQAHGGGIIKVGDTYYWFGEDRSQDNERGKRYVACYASKDLVNWTFRNQVIKMTPPPDIGPHMVLERPKVFYNQKTKKFVMYMHVDGPQSPNDSGSAYVLARVGVATCDTVDGDYQYIRSFRPLDKESRDIGQFVDDDGSAYLIFECRPTKGFFIAKLSDDFLSVEKETCFIQAPLEGGALVHYKDLYYAIGSHMSGWAPNDNMYATASHLEGPWSAFKNIAPPGKNTYGSQSTLMLKIVGTKTTSVIFMGDMWKPSSLWDSRYLWMPVEIGDGVLKLPQPRTWTLDVVTGETVVPH